MSSRDEATLPATRPKSRKSLAHPPLNTIDKENMTADIGALGGAQKRGALGERPAKKSRSKSIGPGGLDALKDGTGNRRQVRLLLQTSDNSMLMLTSQLLLCHQGLS
jgi:kinetochore protein Spc7/SPC105